MIYFTFLYDWINENSADIKTSSLRLFQENIYTGIFNQSTKGNLSTHSLRTQLVCVWLAGCRPPGQSEQGYPAKKISHMTDENASLCDPAQPHGVSS